MAVMTLSDPQVGKGTPEKLVENFEALLAEADLPGFLELMGVGRFSLKRKREMGRLFSALCVGIWHLALAQAIPDTCEEAYRRYCDSLWASMRDADAYLVLLSDIASHLPGCGREDFTPAARELLKRAGREESQASLVGLALFMRQLYEYFFNQIL